MGAPFLCVAGFVAATVATGGLAAAVVFGVAGALMCSGVLADSRSKANEEKAKPQETLSSEAALKQTSTDYQTIEQEDTNIDPHRLSFQSVNQELSAQNRLNAIVGQAQTAAA